MRLLQGGLPFAECLDDVRVELLAGLRDDLLSRGGPAYGAAIGAVARHRVERVRDGEDSRGGRDLAPDKPVRIPAAVPALVV